MKRIKEISVKNFKAFQAEQVFTLNGKNVLAFGYNGSGKSSLFWALYTFLQSSIKTDDEVQKYFRTYVESDKETHQTLKNIFMDDPEDSFIKLTAIDTENQIEKIYTISHNTINTNNKTDTLIQELNLASDFINYKLLHNFYRVSHKQEVNLWSVFERDIFPFFTDDTNNVLINKWYKEFDDTNAVEDGRTIGENSYKREVINNNIIKFNDELENFLKLTETNANNFLTEQFNKGKEQLKISLEYRSKFSFSKIRNEQWKEPIWRQANHSIILKVEILKEDGSYKLIERPHSFLNEAQLTRIAIAIRIGALRTRPLKEAKFKILVLDDMLISLDLSNRMDVVRLILNKEKKEDLEFFDNFQKIIFTHDKGFFNLIRRNTDDEEWVYLNFEKNENDNSPPEVKLDESNLQKAIKRFQENNFEASGNELRKEAEDILTSFLDPEMKKLNKEFEGLSKKIEKAYNTINNQKYQKFTQIFNSDIEVEKLEKLKTDYSTDDLLSDEEKEKLDKLKVKLFDFLISFNSEGGRKEKLIQDTKEILDRVMNPASHNSENPLYRAELKDAIEKIKELKNHLNNE